MKNALLLALLPLALLGCRREDIRVCTVSIPALTEEIRPQVVRSLAKYGGIDMDSLAFDFEKKTLTLRYDSMQIAKTNIRMAITEKTGLEATTADQP